MREGIGAAEASSERFATDVRAALRRGAIETARAACTSRLRAHPADAAAWAWRARTELDAYRHQAAKGDAEGARVCLRAALESDPQLAQAWHELGRVRRSDGDTEGAFAALKQALLLDATRASTYLALADLLAEAGQDDDALGCLERAARYDDGSERAPVRLARALAERGKVERAAAVYADALQQTPGDTEALLGRGEALEALGERDRALACYRAVLVHKPGQALALGRLLALAGTEEAAGHASTAWAALDDRSTPAPARALVGYGLARAAIRQGRVGYAVHAGAAANRARRLEAGGMDREALRDRVDRLIDHYDAAFFADRTGWGRGDERPIFVVGLPRTGTTLTEQILAAHPEAAGAGELSDLPRQVMARTEANANDSWRAAATLDAASSRTEADRYLAALARSAPAAARRISDKTPFNLFHLGFAALLCPGARVIHCMRDRRDTALSIWLENFAPDQRYATDLEDIACLATECDRLMAHWRRCLPLPILTVRYEDTVADPAAQARRIVDFLGLEWDDACLAHHHHERAVQTPSRWDVRQPVHGASVGRWRRFAPYLATLETLEPGP